MGVKIQGAFLWTGEEVDFNNFQNTLKDGTDEMSVSFTLENISLFRKPMVKRGILKTVRVSMVICSSDKNFDFIRNLQIMIGKDEKDAIDITIDFKDMAHVNNIKVGGFSLSAVEKNVILSGLNDGLLPRVIFKKSKYFSDQPELDDKIAELLDVKDISISYFRNTIFRDLDSRSCLVEKIKEFSNRRGIQLTSKEVIDKMADLLVLSNVNIIIDSVNLFLFSFVKNISYIQPLRAITQRFYRFQNFAVAELESDGRNLPMFFNSLSPKGKASFNEWISSVFKMTFDVSLSDGNMELICINEQGERRNLMDVGFGYTQMLPILAFIWKAVFLDREDKSTPFCKEHIVAIEQPELHLHPRFQALFADILCKAVQNCKENGMDVKFLIETHSETIINRMGEHIVEEELGHDDVSIVIFNGRQEGLEAEVHQTCYSEDGYINDWPYGFFSGE